MSEQNLILHKFRFFRPTQIDSVQIEVDGMGPQFDIKSHYTISNAEFVDNMNQTSDRIHAILKRTGGRLICTEHSDEGTAVFSVLVTDEGWKEIKATCRPILEVYDPPSRFFGSKRSGPAHFKK